ncbi:MAG: cell division protein FtsZ [Hyphomicrobiaceae bacterium]
MASTGKINPRITVIGVGGAGGNVVNNMIAAGLANVRFVVANTDMQALASSRAELRIQLGVSLTEGLGAGSDPEIGEAAAEEAGDEIRAAVADSHMVFIAAGMGGGTGTGAAYVVAREARDCGVLSIAVVTKPFQFEGAKRLRNAEAGIAELRKYADTLLVIPNENLFRIATDRTTFADAFVMADQVMYSGIVTITDLIMKEGLINLDLADVKAVLGGMGRAMMGMGEAVGEQRAIAAAEEAIVNPLLDEVTLKGAKSLLLCITGGRDMTLWEVEEAASRVCQEVDPDANIIVGATFDDGLGDRIRVSIVASGMPRTTALPEPDHDADLPAWTPRSQREGAGEPYGRRMAEQLAGGGPYGTQRATGRGRGKSKRGTGEGDAGDRAMAMAGDVESAARAGLDGLSALPKTPARPRKGAGGGRRAGETGAKRPPTLPDGVEVGEARRRTRRTAADGHPPPVNWRELTAPEEGPPARPSPPVNWRERAAHSNGSARSDPEYDGSIVPEREPEEAPPPRKMGFFERLGFGRRRA